MVSVLRLCVAPALRVMNRGGDLTMSRELMLPLHDAGSTRCGLNIGVVVGIGIPCCGRLAGLGR